MMRLKSLAGEPSMYVFTVFPLLILAVGYRHRIIAAALLLSVFMTGSSTALFAFIVFGITHAVLMRSFKPILYLTAASVLIAAVLFPLVQALIRDTAAKLALESFSGQDRLGSFLRHLNYWLDSPIHIKLFGIGFGAVRSADFLTTLLVNTGLVGFALFTVLFLYPAVQLGHSKDKIALRSSLFSLYFMFLTSVAEYSYAIPWIILGIAYKEKSMELKKKLRRQPEISIADALDKGRHE